jgi:PAS domain S-box-containing protein
MHKMNVGKEAGSASAASHEHGAAMRIREGDRNSAANAALSADGAEERRTNLTQAERQCRHMLALCHDGIFLIMQGNIVYANRAAMTLLGGGDRDHVQGRPILDFLPHGGSTDLSLHITDIIDNTYAMRRKLRRLDTSLIDVEVAMAPYREGGHNGYVAIVHDLAARSRGSGRLGLQDQALHLLTDTAPALIGYIDQSARFRFVNATASRWFGKPADELIGCNAADVAGLARDEAQASINKALCGERARHDYAIDSAIGPRHISTIYVPYKEDDGVLRGVLFIAVNEAARERRKPSPHQEHYDQQVLDEAAPVFVARCDSNYRIRALNKTFAAQFGLRPHQMIGELIPKMVGETAFSQLRSYVDAALSGKPQEHVIRLPFKNGEPHYLHLMYIPESDTGGRIRGLIVAASDLTRLRRADEQLHRREHDFKTLVENSPDAISRIDRNMRHIYVNPAIETVTGLRTADYLGKTKRELGLPQSLVEIWDGACQAAFDTGTEQQFYFELQKNADTRYFSARVIPETDRDGRIESVLGISYDVTARTMMEKEHQQLLTRERSARIQAETAAKARDEFLAIVSHELRAPLNGIQSWAHILENYVKDATASPLAQRALNGIRIGVGQQVRLIEDLLDVTRMMSGKLRLVKQPFKLLPVLQTAVESVRELATAKQIGITCTYQISSEQIDGDADRVQQAVWNLLSNAIKFTPEAGNVWFSAIAANSQVTITVRDDGVGISPDFLPHLFDRFSQQDTSSTRGHSGLGLGLFLVRHLIELHGGSVKAESLGVGKGTTFSISLPLHIKSHKYTVVTHDIGQGENDPVLPSLEGLRILLVDDQEEARESLAILLATVGASVFPASSSKEAFAWLGGVGPDELPDILICDIAMPVEDGYSVLRKIRTWETGKGITPLRRLPALALTAFTQREDRIRALTAGFQMHMTKPVSPEELIVVIAMMTARS